MHTRPCFLQNEPKRKPKHAELRLIRYFKPEDCVKVVKPQYFNLIMWQIGWKGESTASFLSVVFSFVKYNFANVNHLIGVKFIKIKFG